MRSRSRPPRCGRGSTAARRPEPELSSQPERSASTTRIGRARAATRREAGRLLRRALRLALAALAELVALVDLSRAFVLLVAGFNDRRARCSGVFGVIVIVLAGNDEGDEREARAESDK